MFEYLSIIPSYYQFESLVIKSLKDNSSAKSVFIGFLIDKKWIDEWKKNMNYENIKNKFLKNQNINFNEIKYQIIKEILINKNNNGNKFEDKKKIEILKFENVNSFEEYIKNNSLVIINEVFLYFINNKFQEMIEKNKIKFKISKFKINIFINEINIEFDAESNVLLSRKEVNLKILFKIFYFQEELKKNIKLQTMQNLYPIRMIQKEWIHKLKSIYEYDKLYSIFKEKIKEFNIKCNYDSLNENIIEKIIETLPDDYTKKIKDKKNLIDLNQDFILI